MEIDQQTHVHKCLHCFMLLPYSNNDDLRTIQLFIVSFAGNWSVKQSSDNREIIEQFRTAIIYINLHKVLSFIKITIQAQIQNGCGVQTD